MPAHRRFVSPLSRGYRRIITIDLSYQAESKPVRPLGMLITQVVFFPAQTYRQQETGAGAAS